MKDFTMQLLHLVVLIIRNKKILFNKRDKYKIIYNMHLKKYYLKYFFKKNFN